jgi:hypothetical protein
MQLVVAEKTENHCADAVTWQEESLLRNRRCQLVQQNVFGLCIRLWVLHRSGKSKWDSNAVSGCWENWKILWQVLSCCLRTVFPCFLGNSWPFVSPVSFSRTYSTSLSLCKGRKCSSARIGNNVFRGCSLLLTLQQEHSVSLFSWQPQTLSSPIPISQTDSTA